MREKLFCLPGQKTQRLVIGMSAEVALPAGQMVAPEEAWDNHDNSLACLVRDAMPGR